MGLWLLTVFSISGFVLVPCRRLSWFLLAFDRTLTSHSYLLTYSPVILKDDGMTGQTTGLLHLGLINAPNVPSSGPSSFSMTAVLRR